MVRVPLRIGECGSPATLRGTGGAAALTLLGVLSCWTLGACAGLHSEQHVAPLFTRLSPAGGGIDIEAAAGILVARRNPVDERWNYWALRPFLFHNVTPNGDRIDWFIPPLGTYKVTNKGRNSVWQFLPLARYSSQVDAQGRQTWSFFALPLIYWSRHADGTITRAWFPFGGVVEHFFSYDRAWFILFPLYLHTERHGRVTNHVLWPFFSVSTGAGGSAWRVWPLIGVNRWEGRYERWFFLWPFFQFQIDEAPGAGADRHTWMVWPLFGASRRGDARSYTGLWPFFGYAKDPTTGFWAWDGPWPLIVFQGGDPERAVRKRVWPFYSFFEGDGLTSRYYLWPIFNLRREIYTDTVKFRTHLIPFWLSMDRYNVDTGRAQRRKLWPLFREFREEQDDFYYLAFPDLNPFWRLGVIEASYSWLWELYTVERRAGRVRSRTMFGLWRREKDQDEDRRSITLLWARRDYSFLGERVTETSWLLGLLRFRRSSRGLQMLRPAFPGPGWPLERVPNSILPPAQERP